MNRTSRKANFKKLQLPATTTGGNTRKTKNSKTTTISNYFTTSHTNDTELNKSENQNKEEISVEDTKNENNLHSPPLRSLPTSDDLLPAESDTKDSKRTIKRTKLTSFVLRDKKIPSTLHEPEKVADDFETPVKNVKKSAPRNRAKASSTTSSTKTKTKRSKRQPNIKSAFLRNEQIFSEIAAQHCMAEHFSADDMQMALAISKSEAEANGILCEQNIEDDVVVDLLNYKTNHGNNAHDDSIRRKLQKYGFRTAPREDYNSIAANFLPGASHRIKSKWANKFTALTLRNPDVQVKKLQDKINQLLAQQFKTKSLNNEECELQEYAILSRSLRKCQAKREVPVFALDAKNAIQHLADWFVRDLFEVSHLQAGYLLKNWSMIQGRDLSPKLKCQKTESRQDVLQKAYTDLEQHFLGLTNVKYQSVELEECRSLTILNTANSPIREPPDKKLKLTPLSKESNDGNVVMAAESFHSQNMRVTSPDIFADSDTDMVEAEIVEEVKSEKIVRKEHSSHVSEDLATYVIDSSDEANCNKKDVNDSNAPESVIDLTHQIDYYHANIDKVMEEEQCSISSLTVKMLERKSLSMMNLSGWEDDNRDYNYISPPLLNDKNSPFKRSKSSSLFTLDNYDYGGDLKSSKNIASQTKTDIDECIILTDDEDDDDDDDINLTISKANESIQRAKKLLLLLEENAINDKNAHEFSVLDLIEDDECGESVFSKRPQVTSLTQAVSTLDLHQEDHDYSTASQPLTRTPTKSTSMLDFTRERLQFGILDSCSEPFTQSSDIQLSPEMITSESDECALAEASFVPSPSENEAIVKRYSCNKSSQKFNELLSEVRNEAKTDTIEIDDDFDEFDALVYGNKNIDTVPSGLEQLLTGEINYCDDEKTPLETNKITTTHTSTIEEHEINGKIYETRFTTAPKPDFAQQTDAELLKQLYEYGIKPLKRKQAIKMLEYIYNQTHPLVLPKEDNDELNS